MTNIFYFFKENFFNKARIAKFSAAIAFFWIAGGCTIYKYRGYRATTDLYELPLAPVASIGGFVRPLLAPDDYHFGYHSCWLGLISPLPFITSEVFATKPSLPDQWFPPEDSLDHRP